MFYIQSIFFHYSQHVATVCDSMSTRRSLTERPTKMKWRSCHFLMTILLFWTVKLMHISTVDAVLDPEEDNAIRVLGNAIALPRWTGDPCSETWIVCSDSDTFRSVLALILPGANLTGIIPPDIAKLRNITYINFNKNQLVGPIPDMRNLTNLTTLLLAENRFRGSLPESLFRLKSLIRLDLHGNRMNGTVPRSLENMTQATYINLRSNLLEGPLPSLSAFVNLEQILMADNRFSGRIPESLFRLKSLTILSIHTNQLTGNIPRSLENMTHARYINLKSNFLVGPLPNLTALVNLVWIDVSMNGLVGPWPDIQNLQNLRGLTLSHNFFNGSAPILLFQHSSLEFLFMSNNSQAAGPMPDMTELSNLRAIDASFCNFQGPIPYLENNKLLQVLSFQFNHLTSIQPDLRSLIFLQTLVVHSNEISGNLPKLPSAAKQLLDKLTRIDFSNNSFSGEIPKSWADLSFLEDMQIGNNMVTGVIPKEIGNLRLLKKLNLSNNLFSGPIPEEISFLENLQILDLRHNQLSGIIPEGIANLSKLESLYLDGNNFTGIPASLVTKLVKENVTISLGNLKIIDNNETATSTLSSNATATTSTLSSGKIAGIAAGASCAGIIVLAIILLFLRTKKKGKQQLSPEDMPKSAQAFSLKQIKAMTQNFKKLIGKGGFGPVYYGKLPNGKEVAVKVRATDSKQGAKEFLNEVQLLSRLHHRNLVPLFGYCLEAEEQILVYKYMPRGTLHNHLHNLPGSISSQKEAPVSESLTEPLDWKTRLNVAINSARGLEYLHKDCNPPVIHRDVKSSNILLTDKLEAKFGDLGISKQAHEPDTGDILNMTGITTTIKGTFGYLDPEYYTSQKLTTKSDVYGFGIILLEIITGKRAQTHSFPDSDATSLRDWVGSSLNESSVHGNITSIADPALKGDYNEEGMLMVAKTALSCVLPTGAERPEMGDIVHTLIEAFQMEELLSGESVEVPDEIIVPLSGQLSTPHISDDLQFSLPNSSTHSSWNTDPR